MNKRASQLFAFSHTFSGRNHSAVITELQKSGASGVNLALNYHASRDFLLRQGPTLEYLVDGFHYYLPSLDKYPANGFRPEIKDHLNSSDLLNSVIRAATFSGFNISAWAVFLHNSAIGKAHPEATVTNALGNHFLSELCPANPGVQGYVDGLVADLSSRGISAIAMESLHFHGARHGEHHERFFLEMSKTTEFLFSLCFCSSCCAAFESEGGDAQSLKNRVESALQPFLEDADPWLRVILTQDLLKEILGESISAYLRTREKTVSSLYAKAYEIAQRSNVKMRLVDQCPLLDFSDNAPLDSSWLLGINYDEVQNYVHAFEPLVYRAAVRDAVALTEHYQERIKKEIIPILRPTFPDNLSKIDLKAKVSALRTLGIDEIDFYLLDTMRPRDLSWIKSALA